MDTDYKSMRLLEGGYLPVTLDEFASHFAGGITISIDMQSERKTEQVLLGSWRSNGTGLVITYNDSNEPCKTKVHLRDNAGRELIATATLSNRAGKRLLFRVHPPRNSIAITELTITSGDDTERSINYIAQDSPQDFSTFSDPLIVSGHMFDGIRKGNFIGRVANLALFGAVLDDDQIDNFRITTTDEILSTYGQRTELSPNKERREVFIDDLARMRRWHYQEYLTMSDTRDASTVIFKWLIDEPRET